MTYRVQISSNPLADIVGGLGGDVVSQLSGVLGQAQALVSAGVGLPGLNSIGSMLSAMGPSVTAAGGSQAIADQIKTIGNQMSTASMADMSGLLSSLSSQISSLTSMLNGGGILSSVLHTHILDKAQGIVHSAFQGQHTQILQPSGIAHISTQLVNAIAPVLPHNGNILGSDNFVLTKAMTAASFGTSSDARLKSNIQDMPAVLDRVMRLEFKTFHKRFIHTDESFSHSVHQDGEDTFGLIAQEARESFPEIVRGDEAREFLTIDEPKTGMLALKAIQELVVDLRSEIAALRTEIAELKQGQS